MSPDGSAGALFYLIPVRRLAACSDGRRRTRPGTSQAVTLLRCRPWDPGGSGGRALGPGPWIAEWRPDTPRPFLHARYPVHVVLRVIAAVGNLRRRCTYQAIREATLTTARREDVRIVQLSIQRTHVHLVVEAADKRALACRRRRGSGRVDST